MTVLCIQQKGLDPYFHLAAEEYLLKNFDEDVFMLWQGESSIVVGKHQNALAEINHRYVAENGIKIARRLSGGGTVFHDPGNLNFTFIKTVERIDQVNFKVFTQPIVEVLKRLGLDAYTTGRNDLMLDGKKISGNAEHVFKKRVLHHGTLLYNSELGKLKNALKVDLSRFEDKAVQSNRSEVTNIANYLDREMSVNDFSDFIFEGIRTSYPEPKVFQFSEDDIEKIQKLREEKYASWDWIYGYSPKYKYSNRIDDLEGNSIQFTLEVVKGVIHTIDLFGKISNEQAILLTNSLLNARHDYEELEQKLRRIEIAIKPISVEKLLTVLV
ncbi:lipoate--protein ligase [uncultured Sunxiuqinia sp.]|uniref:lipoate--protein ligase n=1 Tax=uncultured Sunxiuqinia sp. TaxID=1573825 RepID=UPI002AA85363|nr:lipoate--protein ligase [uncultured Sunxiuqinia sp.]